MIAANTTGSAHMQPPAQSLCVAIVAKRKLIINYTCTLIKRWSSSDWFCSHGHMNQQHIPVAWKCGAKHKNAGTSQSTTYTFQQSERQTCIRCCFWNKFLGQQSGCNTRKRGSGSVFSKNKQKQNMGNMSVTQLERRSLRWKDFEFDRMSFCMNNNRQNRR